MARVRANLEALRTLRVIQREDRPGTAGEQRVLARWSGWGAVPEIFSSDRPEYRRERDVLAGLLSSEELAAAARNTLNAHYTDAELVQVVWAGVHRLGFTGGRVLEPGCGSGNFIGFAPVSAEVVGVELDPVTAAIAAALYPDAQVLNESFADTRAQEGSFDLVIGNVPFGKVTLNDRRHNAGGHSIHNHFIVKGLRLTRHGGLVAVLTSRFTMDARNPAARREIAGLADLVGAVRLPSGAHQRAAGTAVVTDLLIFRRREPGRPPAAAEWEQARPVELAGGQVTVNRYFLDHPDSVLGELAAGSGMYGPDLLVHATGDAGPALSAALVSMAERAARDGLMMSAAGPARATQRIASAGEMLRHYGYLQAHADGTFTCVRDGQAEPHEVARSQAGELRQLLGLRDAVMALLEAEAGCADDTAEMDGLRAGLARRYDAYARAFGPVNRFSWRRTGRGDPGTGQERMARVRPSQGGFRSDPFSAAVYALEVFDPVDQHATKAAIFGHRVVAPRAPRLGADTPADALAICLDSFGEVRIAEVARLLGCEEAEARGSLGELLYDDPVTGRLVPAPEYLSGNVRTKLAAAEAAAATNARFAVNVTALAAVIPRDLGPGEIDARLGASWIDAGHVEQFLREILEDPAVQVDHPGGSVWTVRGASYSVLATARWGTERVPGPQLAQAVMEQRHIRVYDEIDGGGRVLNLTETVAAQEKATELCERFSEWVWEDPVRAAVLGRVYNDRFNAVVLRSYDDVVLSLPGLAVSFTPRAHQVAAVARMIHQPAVGLFHEVGAGKTAEMAMGAMELRRLGLVTKPAIVVPNHMLEQLSREFLQLYPRARVLAAGTEDLERSGRRVFVARCATGDWDAVIMSRSAFERIPMSPAAVRAYLDHELRVLREQIGRSRQGNALSVKRLERALLQAEERIKRKLDGVKDPGVTWEQTGIDYLEIDEAHAYKNLRTASNIPGVAIDGSQRASDLDMKLAWLRSSRGSRVVAFATATPIANSVTEAYVMQRYLQPEVLAEAGIEDFDSWAATFGKVTSEIELAPAGGGFRVQARFAKFVNVPELLRLWHLSADVKTAEDLELPAPSVAGGGPQTVVVEPSPDLISFVAELGDRADRVRSRAVDPSEDNMLKVSTDGRLAALDLRLVGRDCDVPGKVEVAAGRIAAIWAAHAGDVYDRPGGGPDPVLGSLQLVFCDLGTPRDGWNVYGELREQLVARGVPAGVVRFVHEARNDREKAELFAACRAGRVGVLVGSTERMGVGTNVQDRAVALHHLDCPWRPADLQQRDGRILRQGNRNSEVQIFRYVTESSFDGYLWQTVERKARFIAQVMRGQLDVREIEDVGNAALSYSEVKALAAGDPHLLEKAKADAELTRLDRLERAWARSQSSLRRNAEVTAGRISRLEDVDAQITAALARRVSTRGDAFVMDVGGVKVGRRADAATRVRALVVRAAAGRAAGGKVNLEMGVLGAFAVAGVIRPGLGNTPELVTWLDGVPDSQVRADLAEVVGAGPAGLITRLENRLAGLERLQSDTQAEIGQHRAEQLRAREALVQPFSQRDQLAVARNRVRELEEQMRARLDTQQAATEQNASPCGEHVASRDGYAASSSPVAASIPSARVKEGHDNAQAGCEPFGGSPAVVLHDPALADQSSRQSGQFSDRDRGQRGSGQAAEWPDARDRLEVIEPPERHEHRHVHVARLEAEHEEPEAEI